MSKIFNIIKWEFFNRLKTKLFIFTTFILPLLIGGITYLPTVLIDLEPENSTNIGLVYPEEVETLVKYFQNQTQSSLLLKNGLPQFQFVKYSSEQEALDGVLSKNIDAYMHIPITILDTGRVSYYSRSLSNIKIYTNLRKVLSQIVVEQRMLNQNIDLDLIKSLSKKINFETFELDDFGAASEGNDFSSFFLPYIFLMILFMTIFMSGQLLLRSVMEERTSRTIEILLCSVTPDELMRGKILGLGALGTVQMLFYLTLGLLATQYRGWAIIEYSQIPIFLIYFLTGYLFYAAIFASMGTFFTSEQEAQQSSGIISLIAVLPIAFASYFITNPDSSFTIAVSYLPPLTPFMMIIRLGTESIGGNEIFFTSVLMVLSCWFLLNIAGKIFRTAILLYGKKITVSEVFHWIQS